MTNDWGTGGVQHPSLDAVVVAVVVGSDDEHEHEPSEEVVDEDTAGV